LSQAPLSGDRSQVSGETQNTKGTVFPDGQESITRTKAEKVIIQEEMELVFLLKIPIRVATPHGAKVKRGFSLVSNGLANRHLLPSLTLV
jgi:hypothetical protein